MVFVVFLRQPPTSFRQIIGFKHPVNRVDRIRLNALLKTVKKKEGEEEEEKEEEKT